LHSKRSGFDNGTTCGKHLPWPFHPNKRIRVENGNMPETLIWQDLGEKCLCDLGPYRVVVWLSWKGDAALWQVHDRTQGAVVLKFAHTPGGIDCAKQEAAVWTAALPGLAG
jgi:hypothetical protein